MVLTNFEDLRHIELEWGMPDAPTVSANSTTKKYQHLMFEPFSIATRFYRSILKRYVSSGSSHDYVPILQAGAKGEDRSAITEG